MIATRAFRHRQRMVAIGDRFTASPIEAAAYVYQRIATFDQMPEATPAVEPPKRRTYRRRDLTAEASE